MPFVSSYGGVMRRLREMGTGKCNGKCKSSWSKNIRYAVKSKTNPLHLTRLERKYITRKLQSVSGKNGINNHSKTLKKYQDRKSPPFPANKNRSKEMMGNDGKMYISTANKNDVYSWKKV
jgi:hypothetical protein